MNHEAKIVQYLSEAHALESALIQTLSAHIAVTPRSEYRDLLEQHLGETKDQAGRLLARLSALGETKNPLELAYGLAQTAVGQVVAATKAPIDLLRGTAAEEKLLKNAKDEAASEALEIATYDALEALAEAAGDAETATLAREHRAQEEATLRRLRELIPQLTRDVLAAEAGDGPYDAGRSGAADAARAVATQVRQTVEKVGTGGAGAATTADLPIDDYDGLPVQQIVPKLRLLTMPELARIEAHERAGRQRKQVLDRIAKLRATTGASEPARR